MDSKGEDIYNRKFYDRNIVFLLEVLGAVLLREVPESGIRCVLPLKTTETKRLQKQKSNE